MGDKVHRYRYKRKRAVMQDPMNELLAVFAVYAVIVIGVILLRFLG